MKTSIDRNLNKTTREIRVLQYEMTKIEAERWERRGVNANALLSLSRAIPIVAGLDFDGYYSEVLQEMSRIISKGNLHVSPGSPTASIIENLRAVPNRFALDVENIERRIREAQNTKQEKTDSE